MARGKKIDPSQVQRIKRLLESGHGVTAIAQEVGVGKATVDRIRKSTRGRRSRYRRCSVCGGMVRPPCILCRARRELGRPHG